MSGIIFEELLGIQIVKLLNQFSIALSHESTCLWTDPWYNEKMIYKIIRRFIPLAFLATALCGLVYLAVQQAERQGANDPQIQMAEDAAAQLATGTSTIGIIPATPVDINTSLAPYIVIYDASGNPIAGNGILDGTLPNLPAGVFNYAANAGEDRFTWQPRSDIRQAVVVVPAGDSSGGFVMAGRSLREVEIREDHTQAETAAAWLFSIGGLLILEVIFAFIEATWRKKYPSKK